MYLFRSTARHFVYFQHLSRVLVGLKVTNFVTSYFFSLPFSAPLWGYCLTLCIVFSRIGPSQLPPCRGFPSAVVEGPRGTLWMRRRFHRTCSVSYCVPPAASSCLELCCWCGWSGGKCNLWKTGIKGQALIRYEIFERDRRSRLNKKCNV